MEPMQTANASNTFTNKHIIRYPEAKVPREEKEKWEMILNIFHE